MIFGRKPVLFFTTGVAVGVIGFFLIGFHCPYGLVATVMTGRITIPGVIFLPYKWVLALAVYLVLHALYVWLRQNEQPTRDAGPSTSPALFAVSGFGVALIGFLITYFPCPYPMNLWMVLTLEGPFDVPYGAFLVVAAGLLVWAAFARARQHHPAKVKE